MTKPGRTKGDHLRKMHWVGWVLFLSGAMSVFVDGGGNSALFRWWHPLAWLTWIVTLVTCGVIGEKVSDSVPFRLSDYWKERKDKIEWLSVADLWD